MLDTPQHLALTVQLAKKKQRRFGAVNKLFWMFSREKRENLVKMTHGFAGLNKHHAILRRQT